jgi:23S rRNA pseudouridine1911/1915/1917 synthase
LSGEDAPGLSSDAVDATDPTLVQFEVEPGYAGWTLSAYVAEKLRRPLAPDRLDRMLRGRSLVHREPELLPDTRIWAGLRFALRKRSPGDEGEPPPIRVVYEDDALLVVDKPPGLALHPTARYHVSTLTHALETRHRNAAGQKPDPAHRLDRETSGLVACGRDPTHTRALKASFAARAVEKSYLALVEGEPPDGELNVDAALSVGTERIKVMVRVDPGGFPAATAFRVLARYRDGADRPLALVRCFPRTGRQHQIRAHLKAGGFPLVGDKLYGPDEGIFLKLAESGGAPAPRGEFDALITPEERRRLRHWRQALHADELELPHPATGERMRFTSALPDDLELLVRSLRRV